MHNVQGNQVKHKQAKRLYIGNLLTYDVSVKSFEKQLKEIGGNYFQVSWNFA